MKLPALKLLPGTRLASTCFPPRCGLPRDGPHDPWHPGQISLACSKIFPPTQTEQNLGTSATNLAGEQIALLELDFSCDGAYWNESQYELPEKGPDTLEIQFLDVRDSFRHQSVGTAIVDWLLQHYPERQLIALSEEADGFGSR